MTNARIKQTVLTATLLALGMPAHANQVDTAADVRVEEQADLGTVRVVMDQLLEEFKSNPKLMEEFRQDPEKVLSSRGISMSRQKELRQAGDPETERPCRPRTCTLTISI